MKNVLTSLARKSTMSCKRPICSKRQSIIRLLCCILIAMVLGTNSNPVIAQETDSKWHFLIEPYLMFPGMKGETTVRQLPATEVDADAGDIFSNLKFGAMLYLEATNNNWTITTDFLYMDLEQDATTNAVISGGDVSMKEVALEFAGLKRVTPWLDAGIAARIVKLEAGLDLETIGGNRSGSRSKTWVDPVIVFRSQGTIQEKWLLQLRGDLGGFGIGSDFTWQIQANAGYRFSKLFQASIGYRILAIDYDKGDESDRFMYDVNTFGPMVRLGFNL